MFKLIKLGLNRTKSQDDYRSMQSYIAEATIKELENRGVNFAQSHVLELGSGKGGYSIPFSQKARKFIASDLYKDAVYDDLEIPFVEIDVLKKFSLESNQIDLIYCSSLIEHLANPESLLSECFRVLKPNGTLFLSFPPFYSLSMVGGHNFKPFHFLGERLAIRLTNFIRKSNIQNYDTCYGTYGLHPLKIDQVKKLIFNAGFSNVNSYTRMSAINTTRLPWILKDLLTWHVCYLAQKQI